MIDLLKKLPNFHKRCLWSLWHLDSLSGGFNINTVFTNISLESRQGQWQVTCDTWHMTCYTRYMTLDTTHMTLNALHIKHDTQQMTHIYRASPTKLPLAYIKKNPAHGTHGISLPMRIVAPLQWRRKEKNLRIFFYLFI